MKNERCFTSPKKTALTLIFILVSLFSLCAIATGCSQGNGSSLSDSVNSSDVRDNFDAAVEDKIENANGGASASEVVVATPLADQLTEPLSTIAANSSMNVAITFVDLLNPQDRCSINGSRPQYAASTIKLLILNELLNQANQGLVSLDEIYTLKAADIVGGTGSLQGRGVGASVTFRDLATLMIAESDNTAANILIERLGMNVINQRAAELGLISTSLNRLMMEKGIENLMSSDDAARLLQMAYDGTFVNADGSVFALTALEAQTINDGIMGGLPIGTAFAHKTGTLSTAQNDYGIVLGEHPYILSIFCQAGDNGYFSQAEALNIMAQCAQLTNATVMQQ